MRVLEQLVEIHGTPTEIKSDNGPEFVARKVQAWIEERGVVGLRGPAKSGPELAKRGKPGATRPTTHPDYEGLELQVGQVRPWGPFRSRMPSM